MAFNKTLSLRLIILQLKTETAIMKNEKITQEVLKVIAEWLSEEGKIELSKIYEQESETESDILNMSIVKPEQLKVPYNL